jgi:cell division protease FtsH
VDESYDAAEDLLVRNRALLDKLASDLIEYETVDSKHLARLVEEYAVDKVPAESATPNPDGGHPRGDEYLD